ncbi:MAG: DUF1490 domain-containing protein [Firmicutes bacterium]|nr:DUF1490 domain-containing protein [Bacillota bacterium]
MLKDVLKSTKFLCFVGGAAAAFICGKIAKCEKTRELCVHGLAKGMKLKHDAQTAVQNLKEDAQDVYYDAMTEADIDAAKPVEEA